MRIGMPGPGGLPDGRGGAAARPVVPSGLPGAGCGPSAPGSSASGPAASGGLVPGAVVVRSRVRHERPTLQEYRFASALRGSPAKAAEPVARRLDGIPALGEGEASSSARAAVPTGVSAAGDVGVMCGVCDVCGIGVLGVANSGAAGSAFAGGAVGGGGAVVSARAFARVCGAVLCDPGRRARPGASARARALALARVVFRVLLRVERNTTAFHGIYLERVSRSPVRRRVWDAYGRTSPSATRTVPASMVSASAAAAPTAPVTAVPALTVPASAGEGTR